MKNDKEILNIAGFNPVYKGVPPFTKVSNGHGYIGVLLEEENSGKLQCHVCGECALNLAKHLYHKHKELNPTSYREKFGINKTTPLMSPQTLKKIKNNFLDLTEEKQKEIIARLKNNLTRLHKEGNYKKREAKGTSQMQNSFGTCPEQAKERFWKLYKELGRIPKNNELTGTLKHIVYSRFKNYKEALIAWGVSEHEYRMHVAEGKNNAVEERAKNDFFPKYSDEDVKKQYQDFYFRFNRFPTWGEVKQYGMPGRIPFMRVFGKNKSELQNSLVQSENEY
jgi:hypothetical protein